MLKVAEDTTISDKKMLLLRVPLSFAVACIGVLILFRGLLGQDLESILWADSFDPNLLRWTAEWGHYALGKQFSLDLFWNAQSFYPHHNTLTYSDSLLTLQLFYTPLRWVGFGPHAALYLSLAGISIFGFMLSVYLISQTRMFSFVECLLIAFIAHFSLCMTSFLAHYQLFGFHFAAPFFIAQYLYFRSFRIRWLLICLMCFALGVSLAVYLAPMMFAGSLVVAGVCLGEKVMTSRMKDIATKLALGGTVVAVFGAALYFFEMRYYLQMIRETPKQSFEETQIYSAGPASIINGRSIHSQWYPPPSRNYAQYGDWERAYFPGWILLVLSFCGGVRLIFTRSEKVSNEMRFFAGTMLLLGSLVLVLSWGPFLQGIRLPFYYLSHILPGVSSIRAPGRFGMLLALPLGVFSVIALHALHNVIIARQLRPFILALVFLSVCVESLTVFQNHHYTEPLIERHKKLADYVSPGDPIIELPVAGADHFETIRRILEQLNGGLYHHARLLVGYGGRTTEECQTLISFDQRIVKGDARTEELLTYAKNLGVKAFLVHLDRYPNPDLFSPVIFSSSGYSLISQDRGYLIAKLP